MSEVSAEKASRESEVVANISNVDNLPFSLIAGLFRDLRKAKVPGKRRGRGSHQKGEGNTRRSLLTDAWLQFAKKCGVDVQELAQRRADDRFIPAQLLPPKAAFKIISLLVPGLDSEHAYLGMKESKLADAFVKALDLLPDGEDALWLKHHKEKEYRPQRWKQDSDIVDGNFGTVVRAVLHGRCPSESSLTIGVVWNVLDTLSKSSRGRSRRIARSFSNRFEKPDDKRMREGTNDEDETTGEPEDGRIATLRALVQCGTPDEVAEVARVILKDVDIRLSEDVFLSWFHPNAKQHYTQIHDIHQLLKDLLDPEFEIGEASVQVGQYASVMLCMRPSRKKLDVICENLRGAVHLNATEENSFDERRNTSKQMQVTEKYFIMEPKLDGERLQLHKWRTQSSNKNEEFEIRTFSRRGNESSAMYADALREVILAGVQAENIILDGEILVWDNLRSSWLRFEDIREVATSIAKRNVPEGSSYTLKYMVFDVLYVDQGKEKHSEARRSGNMVIRLPLYKRRMLMEKIVTRKETSYGIGATACIEVVEMERGHDERELTNTLQRYETLGYEGVIAKNPDMPYALAERSLDIAIKLKPDYFDGGIQDLDVLILGAKYSSSRGHRKQRAGRLSSFLIGVKASDDAPVWRGRGEEWKMRMRKCKWIPVGSVGTGYSDSDLEQIQEVFSGEWKPFNCKDLPGHFEDREYAPTLLSDVAKWIDPWKSIVLTVRAFEVNRRYFALRFPRVERINWDKPYFDVPSFSHLLDLDENKLPATIRPDEADADDISGSLVDKKTRLKFDAEEEEALKRVKLEGHIITGGRNPRSVIASAVGADVSNINRISTAFTGLTFFVIAPNPKQKEDIEVQIHQLGGSFVQSFGSSVDFVICTNAHVSKVKLLEQRFSSTWASEDTCPIILSNWVVECLLRKSRLLPSLNDVVYATKKLETELFEKVDRFGDSWRNESSVDDLMHSLDEVSNWKAKDSEVGIDDVVCEGLENYVRRAMKKSGNVFDGLRVLVPTTRTRLPGSVALLSAFGGRVISEKDANKGYTHILVESSLAPVWQELHGSKKGVVITEKWVQEKVRAVHLG